MQAAMTKDELRPAAEGLERLYAEQHRLVFSAAYRVTGNAMDAEDVVQTVFLRLLRSRGRLVLEELPSSYLHLAAVNGALDILRGRAVSRGTPLDEAAAPLVEDGQPDPERQAESEETRRIVRQAMARLSPRMAEIFTLRYLEGFDNHEIARMLGRSQTFVAVAAHRARKRLREEIRKHWEADNEAK